MRVVTWPISAFAALTLALLVCGCSDSASQGPSSATGSSSATGNGHDHDDDHDHGEEHGDEHGDEHKGPHGGHVIDLGRNHEYHAEIVEDEGARTIAVYVLDGDLKELAIDQPSIVMNLMVDGQAKSFELTSAAASQGGASRFDAADDALFVALHEHEASGKLRVTINDTPYTGEVEHHHDHDGDDDHGHQHDDHKH